jgi:YbbR domain-containing protein
MNLLKNIGKRIEQGLADNTRLAVISLLLAIIVWLMISMGLDQSASKNIDHIQLKLDITGTSVSDNDLIITDSDVEEVKVKIKGSKTQIRNLNKDTLEAYVDFGSITSPGKKILPIKLVSPAGIKFELESISPSIVNITFDRYSSKEVPVIPKVPNITAAEGKVLDEYTCEPSVVNIVGPSSKIDKVAKCYACSDKEFTGKDSAFTVTASYLQLYSDDDVEVEQKNISFSANSFVITVPVLTQKTVKPVVEIINIPDNFNKEILKERLRFSPDSLVIASNNSNAEISDTFEVQKISLNDFDLGYSKDFDISERIANLNMMNKTGDNIVTVSLDDSGLARKEITLDSSRIHLSDIPSDNYDYAPLLNKMTITVVGPADVLDQLTSKDFVADASLMNMDSAVQKLSFDAVISCPTSDEVWSVTKAKIPIQKTLKTEQPTTTQTEDNE